MSTPRTPVSERARDRVIDPAYPRPQFRREHWLSLDGDWSFSTSNVKRLAEVRWSQSIRVPFPPESQLSGLALDGDLSVVWYRRLFRMPPQWRDSTVVLNFGAVDYAAEVWLNGHRAGSHKGGHTPFAIDITELLVDGEQELCVRVEDGRSALDQPRGKQDWQERPHSIWYPRTTGIWQSVWLEPLAETHVSRLRLTPDLQRFAVDTRVEVDGDFDGTELEFVLTVGDRILVSSRLDVLSPSLVHTLNLADPGIDDARNELLWSPEHPTLLNLTITLWREGQVVDRVESYVGMRSVEAREGLLHLNGRPYFQRLVLDQGYWDESHLAPPSPEALRTDVELAKRMGFNGVRKHQKLEDPRYLYWADKLGLLVWTELPSAYSFGAKATTELVSTWLEAIERDYNHPSVVAWVPFNESWGVPDLPVSQAQRDLVAGLYRLTRSLDPSRVVIDNDGWEHGDSDIFTVHDYSHDPSALSARYGERERWRKKGVHFRPGGRLLLLDDREPPPHVLLSEFGGIRYGQQSGGWGYSEVGSPQELLAAVSRLVDELVAGDVVTGFCYTQFADTFQEQNGLLFADRRPKIPLAELAEAIGKGGRG